MTKTRLIGDVHGLIPELKLIVENTPRDVSRLIQIGDMGIGFFHQNEFGDKKLDEYFKENNLTFIRGNHDNPQTCKEMTTWIPDSYLQDDWYYLGGAWSIDQHLRTIDINWWDDEELSYKELDLAISTYEVAQPRVVISHDCPSSIAQRFFFDRGCSLFGRSQYWTKTGEALDTMFKIHQPKLWVFGHWHENKEMIINGTRCICLNELSFCDVDNETLEITYHSKI